MRGTTNVSNNTKAVKGSKKQNAAEVLSMMVSGEKFYGQEPGCSTVSSSNTVRSPPSNISKSRRQKHQAILF